MDGERNITREDQRRLLAQARDAGQRYANESMYRSTWWIEPIPSTRAWDRFLDWAYDHCVEVPASVDASGLDSKQHEVWEAFREEFDGYFGR